jgi:hypothetical protein
MKRNMPRALLTEAKANKKDEFYTQLADIESELKHYETGGLPKQVQQGLG